MREVNRSALYLMRGDTYEQAMQRMRERKAQLNATLTELFPHPQACVLEIGCGHGHFLTAYAAAHPDKVCVGVDLISKRIEKSTTKAVRAGLGSLHFLKAEVGEFLDELPSHVEFEAFFMLFPDPWPKKRHFKNRMIQPALLSRLAQSCASETPFYFRTDHEGYFEWTREHFNEHPDWSLQENSAFPFEETTHFQKLMGHYQSLVALRNSCRCSPV